MNETAINTDTSNFFPGLHVAENGNIYVAYSNIDMYAQVLNGLIFQKSTDGGQSFSTPDTIATNGIFPTIASYQNYVYVFYGIPNSSNNADFYLVSSTDYGNSFGTPIKVNDANPVFTKLEDITAMCTDNVGNIYLAWNDGRRLNGGGDIYFAKSTDNGLSFSQNIPVNDTTAIFADSTQYSPAIAVNGTDVYVAWRENSDNFKIVFAKSNNGGTDFSGEEIVFDYSSNNTSICVNANNEVFIAGDSYFTGHGLHVIKSEPGGINFGNKHKVTDATTESKMNSMAINDNDSLFFIWCDDRNNSKDVFFSKGIIDSSVFIDNNYKSLNAEIYPNPFDDYLFINFHLEESSEAIISIYDIKGSKIQTITKTGLRKGNHNIKIDSDIIKPGIYYLKLKTNKYEKSIKIIKDL